MICYYMKIIIFKIICLGQAINKQFKTDSNTYKILKIQVMELISYLVMVKHIPITKMKKIMFKHPLTSL